jgi:hypothetical protein
MAKLVEAPEKRGYSKEQIGVAVSAAAEKLAGYTQARTRRTSGPIILGPNFDDCYYYKVGSNSEDGYGLETAERARQKAQALKLGLPDLSGLPREFTSLLYLSNLRGRLASGKLIVLKHFPGDAPRPDGNGSPLEDSEKRQVRIGGSLEEMERGPLRPFILAIKMRQPQAIMVSHAAYDMEKDLRRKYPELAAPCSGETPASLSPFIIRGLLRRELGFEGLVMSDWYIMGAIGQFMERARAGTALEGVSQPAALVILAIYAGVNNISCPLLSGKFGDRMVRIEQVRDEVEGYCLKNRGFRAIFESLVAETFYLKAKNMPADFRESLPFRIEDISFGDLSRERPELPAEKAAALKALNDYVGSLPFTDKLLVLTTLSGDLAELAAPEARVKSMYDFYGEGQDVWNRNGILSLKFRKDVVESLAGKKWPDPPGLPENEAGWITALMHDASFRAVYDGIDWNGAGMKKACTDALAGLMQQAGSRLGGQVWTKSR